MIEISKNIVAFEPQEIVEIIRKALAEKGIEREIVGMQIAVDEPFEGGSRIHNDVPRLNVVLAGAER